MARRLSSYLRTLRRTAGLSQVELGYLLGVSGDVICNCERGISRPNLNVLLGCVLVFGKSPAELFPAHCYSVQEAVGKRAAECDRKWANKSRAEDKLALLEAIGMRTITNPGI